jgi:hypothetical protein
VVDLHDQTHVVGRQPVDDPHLPERPAAVEGLGLETSHQLGQLVAVAGAGERGETDVVPDVEAIVVDPDRATLAVRDLHEALAQAWDSIEPGRDVVSERRERDPAARGPERAALQHR